MQIENAIKRYPILLTITQEIILQQLQISIQVVFLFLHQFILQPYQ